jgi:hypothetical protein
MDIFAAVLKRKSCHMPAYRETVGLGGMKRLRLDGLFFRHLSRIRQHNRLARDSRLQQGIYQRMVIRVLLDDDLIPNQPDDET